MGNIAKRPDGQYRARYRDPEGREHSKHFGRKLDAQHWLDEVTTSRIIGQYVDPKAGKITFRKFYDDWSARQIWVSGTVAAMTYAAYSTTFADLEIGKVRKSHVEQWVKTMSLTLAASTVASRFHNVRRVFKAAVADKVRADDPTDNVSLPAPRRAEAAMSIPTPVQVGALLEAADDDLAPMASLAAFAGLRLGEISGVQVADIEFLPRTLHIARQFQDRWGPMEIRDPKYGSERTAYLPDALLMILSEHIARHSIGGQPEAWLFTNPAGTAPPRSNRVNDRWHATCKRAGISGFTLHDLRHFYASGLIAAGCDVVTVQRALGHSSPSITLDTYSHLWVTAEDKTRTAAAGIMSAALADSPRTAESESLTQ
jgi:integrase